MFRAVVLFGKFTAGVKLVKEEVQSMEAPVYTMSEYSSKLHQALNRSLGLSAELEQSDFCLDDGTTPAISAVERQREEMLQLLNLFSRVDPTKRISEWEFSTALQEMVGETAGTNGSSGDQRRDPVRCEKQRDVVSFEQQAAMLQTAERNLNVFEVSLWPFFLLK
jgi:hypothetical protein